MTPRRDGRQTGRLCQALRLFCLAWLLRATPGKTLHYYTDEEEPPGTVIGVLSDDLPAGEPAEARTFRLLQAPGNGSAAGRVAVRERDGQLSVGAARLDREELCAPSEEPCVLAFDVVSLGGPRGGGAPQYGLLHVELEVRDINDHAPRFPAPLLALEVSEAAAPGTRLPLALAHDPDAGSNGVQSFAVSPNSHFGLEAQSRADGRKGAELVLLSALDREAQAAYRLELVAKDGGSPARSGTAAVSVRVLDANDHAPAFPGGALRTVELPEDAPPGWPLLTLDAADPDEGANGQLLYSWGSQVPAEARARFALDPRSGRLSLRAALDYEQQRAYELDVTARDGGASPLAASCKVLVRLLDVNDNAPALAVSALSAPEGAAGPAWVSEAAPPGSLVALVRAWDADAGANGQVRVALLPEPRGAPFALQRAYQASYALLTAGPLDRERLPEYNLTLLAEDRGAPPARTLRRLTVRLADENDNAPRFARPRAEVALPENGPPGAFLAALPADDPDLGPNGRLAYRLRDPALAAYVSLDPASGALYAARAFDYESLRQLEVAVEALDAGTPPLSATALLRVRVLDQNDNAPVITHPALANGSLEIGVSSKASRGSPVIHIKAKDADEGINSELSFALLEDPQQPQPQALDLFGINQKTGEIFLAGSLSEDQLGQVYHALLTVTDGGQPPLATTATVSLLVMAEAPPSISRDVASRASAWEGKALQWDVPLIVIVVLAGSCTLLLVAIVTIATTCNKRKKEREGAQEEPPDSFPLEKGRPEGKGGLAPTSPPASGFEVHSFPSKSSFASPEHSPASEDVPASENSRESASLYGSQSRLREPNTESYASTPSYSKEPGAPPAAIWKGHSFNTIMGREAEFSGKDSGKGDSDFNDSDSDISGDALKKDLITHMQNGLWACTAECKILGHSDRCWSPSCGRSNPHASPHPKAQLSTFCKSTSLPRDSLRRDHFYQAQLPKTVGLQSVYEKVLHRDFERTITLLSPPHPGRLPDLQEISVPLFQASPAHYLGPPSDATQKV